MANAADKHVAVMSAWAHISHEITSLIADGAYRPSDVCSISDALGLLNQFFSQYDDPTWRPGFNDKILHAIQDWRCLAGLVAHDNFLPRVQKLQAAFKRYLSVYRLSVHADPRDLSNFMEFCGALDHAVRVLRSDTEPGGPLNTTMEAHDISNFLGRLEFALGLMANLVDRITATGLNGAEEPKPLMNGLSGLRSDVVKVSDLTEVMHQFVFVQESMRMISADLMQDLNLSLRAWHRRGEEKANELRREATVLKEQIQAMRQRLGQA